MPEKPLAGAVVRAPKPASRFDWPSVVVLAVVSGKPAVADRGWFCQPEVAVLAPALGVAATWSCLQGLLAPKRPHDSQPVNPSPAKNTLAGTWYLRKLLGRYQQTDNAMAYALADYNAGRTHVFCADPLGLSAAS